MRRPALLVLLLTLGMLGMAPALAAAQPTVFWHRWPAGSSCAPANALRCGEHGAYELSYGPSAPGAQCTPVESGSEAPKLLPLPGPAGGGDWAPCPGLSCFERSGRRPWVAVVDWGDEHGRVVGELVRYASAETVDVELFDLEGAVGPLVLGAVGDLHLLARLCDVAERVAAGDEPMALNLSFGRAPAGGKAQLCAEPSVACEIDRLIHHLSTRGVAVVAAAGNQGQLLFPAELPDVLAAGSLHLARLLDSGAHEPSLETPAGANVLVAGHGLYLKNPADPTEVYALAPGSSFAAATFTGWLTGAVREVAGSGTPPVVANAAWTAVEDHGVFGLFQDGELFPGSDLAPPSELTKRALQGEAHVCQGGPPAPDAPVLRLTSQPAALPALSLIQAIADHGPAPGAQPCAECEGSPPPDGFESPGGGWDLAVRLFRTSTGPLWPYPVTGVFVRTEGTVWRLDRSYDLQLLARLEAGTVPFLLLAGLDAHLAPDDQVSLVYTVRVGDGPGAVEAWTSSPVHVHRH